MARLGLSGQGRVQRLRDGRAALLRRRVRFGRNGPSYRQCRPHLFSVGDARPRRHPRRRGRYSRQYRARGRGGNRPDAADYRTGAHWDCVVSGAAIAMIRMLDVDVGPETLRARIEANLARQRQPELSAIHLVRETSDLTASMPRFVTAFIEKQLAAQ